jgi:hypothetical protein
VTVHNTAKHRALEVLARVPVRWWAVEEWGREAVITPTRRMYLRTPTGGL